MFLREFWCLSQLNQEQTAMMDSSTRITRSEVVDLCETIFAENPDLPAFGARVLGLYLCVRLTLTYLRHNLPQELLAELYGVSQATASRIIAAYLDSCYLGGFRGGRCEFSLVLRWGGGALRGRMVCWCEPVSAQGQDCFGDHGDANRGQGERRTPDCGAPGALPTTRPGWPP